MELFHPTVMPGWRDTIFTRIALNPQHTFIVLTKMPENIDRPMPPNVWLGVSVTGENDFWRAKQLCGIEAKMKFVSIEPLLSDDCSGPSFTGPILDELSWGIIGRLTGHGKKWDPSKETVSRFVRLFKTRDIPVFLKNNLREIWGKPLIQEFPK
jgi:protein gp37